MISAREQAHDVMEQAWQEAQRENRWRDYDDTIDVLLDALLAATQTQTCTRCGGTNRVPASVDEMSGQALNDGGYACSEFVKPCPDCSAGVVAGTEPLVLLGPERVPSGLWDERLGDFVPFYRRAGSPDA